MSDTTSDADLHFWFDPVCPFAWMTSRWVRLVAAQRSYDVEWRPISLRLLNRHVDYDSHFPPEYEAGHTAGLRLLRVVARTRAEHGPAAVGLLDEAGIAHEGVKDIGVASILEFRDPDGIALELIAGA